MNTRPWSLPSAAALALAAAVTTAGCGVPPGRAMQSHRLDAPVWWTSAIAEDAHRVRITVRTPKPEDARAIALRIVNQRRSQSWHVIEVEVQDEHGGPGELFVSEHPHPAATLRDDDLL